MSTSTFAKTLARKKSFAISKKKLSLRLFITYPKAYAKETPFVDLLLNSHMLISYLPSSIKVCCFEVNEDFRIASSHFSYLLILTFKAGKLFECLIRRASVFHQHTKVRGVRRPTFTSTRHDTTRVLDFYDLRLQLPKNLRVVPKKNIHGFDQLQQLNGLLATSPLSANTESQLKPTTRCWLQTLLQVKGQLRPSFFPPTLHEPSSNRSHWDPWINRLPALTYLATQMFLNTMRYRRLQAVAFQADLLQFR